MIFTDLSLFTKPSFWSVTATHNGCFETLDV